MKKSFFRSYGGNSAKHADNDDVVALVAPAPPDPLPTFLHRCLPGDRSRSGGTSAVDVRVGKPRGR